MRKLFVGVIFLFFFLFSVREINSIENNQFITVVNPVRISSYTKDPRESIKAQYGVIKRNNFPATWLLTFDAIENDGTFSIAKRMDKNQELGIFLEVTLKFAEEAEVKYHDTGFWHHATSVFLSGYTQEERIKLINTIFEKFKTRFGYYPTSVGSWWTDSFSLSYMKEKYGITANLGVSDQFSTDGYQVWGQYWSTPFYPSKFHAGIPAQSDEVKLDIVTIQWASRDPINGYKDSLYSTQDYLRLGLDIGYFEKLIRQYGQKGNNEFGQVTVGLEGDFTPEAYGGEFFKQMNLVKRLADTGEFEVITMKQFSNWYRESFPQLSPPHTIETNNLPGTRIKVKWYQSPRYRLGVLYDNEDRKIKILDFRGYHKDFQEPYFISPNRENELHIYIPSYFDQINYEKDVWEFPLDKELNFLPEKILIEEKLKNIPNVLSESENLEIKESGEFIEIVPKENWAVPVEGVTIEDFNAGAIHFFRQKKAIFLLLAGRGWQYFKRATYLIPQGEMDALLRLSRESKGKVLVVDMECLQCSYHTEYRHPAFDNRRGYVKRFSKHTIVYNSSVFNAKDKDEAKKKFQKTKAKYIYLVKFEDNIEKLPFSPGDFGVEKIFENANAEIWKIKE